MHGFGSAPALLVNAEVDSMGGVVEGGVSIGNILSPRQVTIEKVQAEIRQEYDVREERRRELEFLEKGGNPLDFKIGSAASVSVQSTSLTHHNPDREAKGSFAFAASPHGDSVESSGRPGAPVSCEPNSADNLMLFDGENDFSECDQNSLHPHRSNVCPSESSPQPREERSRNTKADSATFSFPKKAYKRRHRSRTSRDGARSGSNDVVLSPSGHGILPSRHGPRNVKGPLSDEGNQENLNISQKCNSKPTGPKGGTHIHMTFVSDGQWDMELDGARASASSKDMSTGGSPNVNAPELRLDGQLVQQSLSGAEEAPNEVVTDGIVAHEAREEVVATDIECCQPSLVSVEVGKQSSSHPTNGAKSDAQNTRAACGLHSESSFTHPSQTVDGNIDNEMHTNVEDIDSSCENRNQASVPNVVSSIEGNELVKSIEGNELVKSIEGNELVKQNEEAKTEHQYTSGNEECNQSHQENGPMVKGNEESNGCASVLRHEAKDQAFIEGIEAEGAVLARVSAVTPEGQTSSGPDLKLRGKADEDSILEEARIIEAKRKRILELSAAIIPLEKCQKSKWPYVLEEMAWLANDFAQERLWKLTVGAQLSYRAAFNCQLKKQDKSFHMNIKKVAHSLAKAVMEFWHSVEDTSKELEQYPEKNVAFGIHSYAVRYLKYNNSDTLRDEAEAPSTPDRISDTGFLDKSSDDHLTEENLFYTVVPGALETYRKSIESHVTQCEKTGSSIQEEVETSACDAVADFESQANAFEGGETSKYEMTVALEDCKSSRFVSTKQKHFRNAYSSSLFEEGPNSSLMHCMENKVVMQQSALTGKRPGNSLNVSIPTKRMRTGSRRVFGHFSSGTSGCVQVPNKTDASSGDANSFQDDPNTLHDGSHVPNSLEVESVGELFDSSDVSARPKKKKKARHLNNTFEQRWQMDSNFQSDQRDPLRKRSENYQLESNGSNGLFGQHIMKKQKIMGQFLDNSYDNITPSGGFVSSPAASQMSNMTNANKFIKMLGGRDRGRKGKALKMPAGHMGSGSPWSQYEDQALIVLVHDMGTNWELISDALNSTLQFKCIFRKPSDCKERHKIVMDRTSGDGADSAEDSGSSQPYPSTLPGIPKGSARQLFQRLQEPVEEDILRSHFEKIIAIGQKQTYRKTQNDNQDSIKPPHCSHTDALSQVCPNNLNGGTVLTPLDLCDTSAPTSDVLPLGHQGPHSSGLTIPNQSTIDQMLPASSASSAVQGSSNVVIGNNISPPVPLSASVRDGRYGVPRPASLSIDEQQRMQQYNQMMSSRNIQQSAMSTPGTLSGTDRGARMLSGGNGMGMVGGITRTMPMMRPGFQGSATSSMVNSGTMVSPVMVSMPSVVNIPGNPMLRPCEPLHMMRQPGSSQDSQGQIMAPDLQMQVSSGNCQGLSPFSGLTSSFPNQRATPPVSPYPIQHQQSQPMPLQQSQVIGHHPHVQGVNHTTSPQQQAFAIHLAKERHLQHQFLKERQQRQFSASKTLMSHVQPQVQPPISSPMRNNVQIQPQTSSSVSLAPSTSASLINSTLHNQQKHQLLSAGMLRNAQTGGIGLTNQMGKQRPQQQRQQFSQANRQHPRQGQQSQSQQQSKNGKGVGKGNMLLHQNIQIDPSLSNGLSKDIGYQTAEKGEATSVQGQDLYSGSAVNAGQSTRQFTPLQSSNQSLPQQKIYPNQAPSSLKHKHQMATHSDRRHVPAVASDLDLSSGHQAAPNNQQAQPHQQSQVLSNKKMVNHNQPVLHRVRQQDKNLDFGLTNKPQIKDSETYQHPGNISEISDRPTFCQPCNNEPNVTLVSPPGAPQRNPSEHSSDQSDLATNMGPLGSPSANSSQCTPETSQALGQRQSPTNALDAQWQQQQPSDVKAPPLQMPKPMQQLSAPLHPRPQAQVMQPQNVSSCGTPGDPIME